MRRMIDYVSSSIPLYWIPVITGVVIISIIPATYQHEKNNENRIGGEVTAGAESGERKKELKAHPKHFNVDE